MRLSFLHLPACGGDDSELVYNVKEGASLVGGFGAGSLHALIRVHLFREIAEVPCVVIGEQSPERLVIKRNRFCEVDGEWRDVLLVVAKQPKPLCVLVDTPRGLEPAGQARKRKVTGPCNHPVRGVYHGVNACRVLIGRKGREREVVPLGAKALPRYNDHEVGGSEDGIGRPEAA